MYPPLADTIALLERTPLALNALLRGLPASWLHTRESPESWSPYDIAGHFVHLEHTDWMVRVRLILTEGASRPFEPIDRFAQQQTNTETSVESLLDEFQRLRASNLAELRALDLQPAQLQAPGLHPALGPVTLGQLLSTWAAHDLTHLHQLSRVLAHRYRQAVGPWSQYLGVLHCDAHGG